MKYLKYTLTLLIIAFISSCGDGALNPIDTNSGGEDGPSIGTSKTFGLVEVTISGIGTDQMTASAQAVIPRKIVPAAANFTPPANGNNSGDGTIEMEPVSNGSFTSGTRGSGGVRYIFATFKVRNADKNGTPYNTPRQNLTFVAANTGGTYGVTAISELRLFDGTVLSGSTAKNFAEQMIPTGWIGYKGSVTHPDVLQVFSESDVSGLSVPTGVTLFPYGFVTRSPNTTPGSRELPAGPGSNQYDGFVTFAYKIPLTAQANQDPFEIKAVFMPFDSNYKNITQSIEEQNADGRAKLTQLLDENSYYNLYLLPGSTFRGTTNVSQVVTLCSPVRVAGPKGSAVTTLFDASASFNALTPNPYATDGSAAHISGTTGFNASFSGAVSNANHRSFVVKGSQSGLHFIGQAYSGNGTNTVATPAGSFLAGEIVEVSLTPGLTACPERVVRYRVAASGDNNVTFSASSSISFTPGDRTQVVAVGDLNNDGNPDIVAGNYIAETIAVLLGDGNGGYTKAVGSPYIISNQMEDIALGDLNEDGNLDIVVAYGGIAILMGDGSGRFTQASGSPATLGTGSNHVALGDLDADGDLDMIVANFNADNVSVFIADGRGNFEEHTIAGSPFATGTYPKYVALGDLDADGDLDIVVANYGSDNISVLKNSGNAWFGISSGITVAAGTQPNAVALGDLNGDGKLDMAVANFGDDQIELFMGDGAFGFSSMGYVSVGNRPRSISIGDLDGDTDLDMMIVNTTSLDNDVTVALNTGNWNFNTSQLISSAFNGSLSDVDIDGDLDIVVADGQYSKVRVWLNN